MTHYSFDCLFSRTQAFKTLGAPIFVRQGFTGRDGPLAERSRALVIAAAGRVLDKLSTPSHARRATRSWYMSRGCVNEACCQGRSDPKSTWATWGRADWQSVRAITIVNTLESKRIFQK